MTDQPTLIPHRRYNPLTGEWVLVSPHRTQRPWRGQVEKPAPDDRPAYDPGCYLCPGNERAGGQKNPAYDHTFVFTNDYASLLPDAQPLPAGDSPFFQAAAVRGTCRVMCFTAQHHLTLAEMDRPAIERVIDVWAEQVIELNRAYRWVQIFENKGPMMGASNAHPHCQIWGVDVLPNEALKEDRQQDRYYAAHSSPLLVDYAKEERQRQERLVAANDEWLVVVPYWAAWPFETLLLPRRPVAHLPQLDGSQRRGLAAILQELLIRYDNLFETSFPYSMGWHGAPAGTHSHWQLHAHFYPPLLRSATIRKFMVGYELLGEVQRDLTPEQAAERLRALSPTHYKTAGRAAMA
jgi:UDPglucose--hexose-1-phosphate uridylyltransferase